MIAERLESLSRGWIVELASDLKGTWKLELLGLRTSRSRFVYRGTLESVVARAYAGEPDDSGSEG